MFRSPDVFGPEVCLDTKDVLTLLQSHVRRIWFEGVHLLHAHEAADRERLVLYLSRLIIIKVAVAVRSHYGVMASLCSGDSSITPSPRHDCRALRYLSVKDLIPSDDAPAMLCKERLHPVCDIALQVCQCIPVIFIAKFPYPCLTCRALRPSCLRTLVTSYMYVLSREHVNDFKEHIFQEPEGLLLAGAHDVRRDTPSAPHIILFAGAAQLRICSDCCKHVGRYINLRYDSNTQRGGISYNFPYLFLCIVSAMRDAVILHVIPSLAYGGLFSHRTDLYKLRIFLYLDSPSLIIGKMPVECVHLVDSHHVKVLLHLIHAIEMPCHVKVHSPVGKSRRVFYPDTRKFPVCSFTGIDLYGKELFQCLYRIEETIE